MLFAGSCHRKVWESLVKIKIPQSDTNDSLFRRGRLHKWKQNVMSTPKQRKCVGPTAVIQLDGVFQSAVLLEHLFLILPQNWETAKLYSGHHQSRGFKGCNKQFHGWLFSTSPTLLPIIPMCDCAIFCFSPHNLGSLWFQHRGQKESLSALSLIHICWLLVLT